MTASASIANSKTVISLKVISIDLVILMKKNLLFSWRFHIIFRDNLFCWRCFSDFAEIATSIAFNVNNEHRPW